MKVRISVTADIELEEGEQRDLEVLRNWEMLCARLREFEEARWAEVAKNIPGLTVSFGDEGEDSQT